MREIVFRAKREDNNQWVYGSLIIYPDGKMSIFVTKTAREFYVKPATIGEYTGITNANGQKIYEGDIIDVAGYPSQVEQHSGMWMAVKGNNVGHTIQTTSMEILGNIHDTPYLLKGETL